MTLSAINKLSIGDRIKLTEPDAIGIVTTAERCLIVEGPNATLVEWQREDTKETGQYIGDGEDLIELAK